MATNYTTSSNMQLIVPTIGQELGPEWAADINYNLNTVLDQHDHTLGHGVPITPNGLNINTNLSFQGNNLLFLRALNLQNQASLITDSLSIYAQGGDLYYNNNSGNQVRITNGASLAGAGGTITGLVSPASASYAGGTFTWQSGVGIPAVMDNGPMIVRSLVSPYGGIRLLSPTSLSVVDLTLPNRPGTQSFLTLDSSGVMAAPWTVDGTSIQIISNQLVAVAGTPDGVTLQTVSGITSVRNGDREHGWELNGAYPGLSYPLNNIDSIFFAEYPITLTGAWIYSGGIGSSGTTEFDIKYKSSPTSSWTSIFSTTGKINATTPLSISYTLLTATATLTNHGFINGETVTISGASSSAYNGSFVISGVTPNTFQYTLLSTPGTNPSVGAVIATRTDAYTDSNSLVSATAGIIKPVFSTTAIPAGGVLRFDLIQSMTTPATDARIRIYYKQS